MSKQADALNKDDTAPCGNCKTTVFCLDRMFDTYYRTLEHKLFFRDGPFYLCRICGSAQILQNLNSYIFSSVPVLVSMIRRPSVLIPKDTWDMPASSWVPILYRETTRTVAASEMLKASCQQKRCTARFVSAFSNGFSSLVVLASALARAALPGMTDIVSRIRAARCTLACVAKTLSDKTGYCMIDTLCAWMCGERRIMQFAACNVVLSAFGPEYDLASLPTSLNDPRCLATALRLTSFVAWKYASHACDAMANCISDENSELTESLNGAVLYVLDVALDANDADVAFASRFTTDPCIHSSLWVHDMRGVVGPFRQSLLNAEAKGIHVRCDQCMTCVCCKKKRDKGPDRGQPDRGPDRGQPDKGPPDRGPDKGRDRGPPDKGPPDKGPPDRGPPDRGRDKGRDRGPPDRGPPDQGRDRMLTTQGEETVTTSFIHHNVECKEAFNDMEKNMKKEMKKNMKKKMKKKMRKKMRKKMQRQVRQKKNMQKMQTKHAQEEHDQTKHAQEEHDQTEHVHPRLGGHPSKRWKSYLTESLNDMEFVRRLAYGVLTLYGGGNDVYQCLMDTPGGPEIAFLMGTYSAVSERVRSFFTIEQQITLFEV